MKLIKATARLVLALALIAAPAGFADDAKQMDALREPVKSVLDH